MRWAQRGLEVPNHQDDIELANRGHRRQPRPPSVVIMGINGRSSSEPGRRDACVVECPGPFFRKPPIQQDRVGLLDRFAYRQVLRNRLGDDAPRAGGSSFPGSVISPQRNSV